MVCTSRGIVGPIVGFISPSVATELFTSQTSILVTHNFGNFPVVQIMDTNNAVLIPLSITHNSVNSFTVTFSSATSGTIIATYGNPSTADVGLPTITLVENTYTILSTDDTIVISGNVSFTIYLPTAVDVGGKIYDIKHTGSEIITLSRKLNTSQLIDGSPTTIINPGTVGAYPNRRVQSDNVGWIIL